MNIYLHIETSVRELDSKLLLAVLAAARGHQVVVSDLECIEKGLLRGYLAPGIFHTKSLTPGKVKIDRHAAIINVGSKITSIDEEGGLLEHGYDEMARTRYSEETINQSSAVFSWGEDDCKSLKKKYHKYSDKFYKTGSPRADLWKSTFFDYWGLPKKAPKKPYLLIVSNMNICDSKFFHERISLDRAGGYYNREPEMFKKAFMVRSFDYLKAAAFIEAAKYLSEHNNGYDIVFRPHPIENVDCWKILLEDIPNVHVIRDGSISAWVQNSFALMHNGCTTGIEATISKTPLVTYATPELKHNNNIPNELGYLIKSKEDLLKKINSFYDDIKSNDQKNISQQLPDQVSKKIYIDNNELAAEKIVKTWESISDKEAYKSINLIKFKFFLMNMRFNRLIGDVLKKLFPIRFGKLGSQKEKSKFPPLNKDDICERVIKLKQILQIDKKIECKLISERTIVIKCL